MTYHWLITLQTSNGRIIGLDGTYITQPGSTRQTAFQEILRSAKQQLGDNNAVTLYFAFEPNEL